MVKGKNLNMKQLLEAKRILVVVGIAMLVGVGLFISAVIDFICIIKNVSEI